MKFKDFLKNSEKFNTMTLEELQEMLKVHKDDPEKIKRIKAAIKKLKETQKIAGNQDIDSSDMMSSDGSASSTDADAADADAASSTDAAGSDAAAAGSGSAGSAS